MTPPCHWQIPGYDISSDMAIVMLHGQLGFCVDGQIHPSEHRSTILGCPSLVDPIVQFKMGVAWTESRKPFFFFFFCFML